MKSTGCGFYLEIIPIEIKRYPGLDSILKIQLNVLIRLPVVCLISYAPTSVLS